MTTAPGESREVTEAFDIRMFTAQAPLATATLRIDRDDTLRDESIAADQTATL